MNINIASLDTHNHIKEKTILYIETNTKTKTNIHPDYDKTNENRQDMLLRLIPIVHIL